MKKVEILNIKMKKMKNIRKNKDNENTGGENDKDSENENSDNRLGDEDENEEAD